MAETRDPFREEWRAGTPVPARDEGRCVWCQGPLKAGEGQLHASTPAVCDACAAVLGSVDRQPLASFIERLEAPVLVVTADCVATLASARACVFLGRTTETLLGQRAGGIRTAWFELTTERAGDLVLLRIDDVGVERDA